MRRIFLQALLVAVAIVFSSSGDAIARPTYFQAMKAYFSVPDDSRVDACIVCHLQYTGTGARNPFGYSVQQYLYAGKSIQETLPLVAAIDSDGDGYTNEEELVTWLTLPGFDCSNFEEASSAPIDLDTYVTPGVATCRDPVEIDVEPPGAGFVTDAGETGTVAVTIWNLGYQDDLEISAIDLVDVSGSGLTLVNDNVLPASLTPGASIVVELSFAPTGVEAVVATLRIQSNDVNDPTYDIPVNGLGVQRTLAPLGERLACRNEIQKRFASYTKTHLREWAGCYAAEAASFRCRSARRDQKIGREEEKLDEFLAGPKDKACYGVGMNAARLDMPETCGGDCDAIALSGIASIRECLLCRQESATEAALAAAFNATPPDLPEGASGSEAAKCAKLIGKTVAKVIPAIQKELAACASEKLANGGDRSECATERADKLTRLRTKVDAAVAKCLDVEGLSGCAFEDEAESTCLGDATLSIGNGLVEAVWAEY